MKKKMSLITHPHVVLNPHEGGGVCQ